MNNMFYACLLLVIVSGCVGSDLPDLHDVTGVVTLDKTPLPGAEVYFAPLGGRGRTSMGITDNDGRFTLQFNSKAKGTVLGKHSVTFSKLVYKDPPGKDDPGKQLLLAKYQKADNLEVEIKPGNNEFTFDLLSKE